MEAAGVETAAGAVGPRRADRLNVVVKLPSALRRFADDLSRVELELDAASPTVGGVIAAIGDRYPGIRDRTLDDQGRIRRHVNVFVDQEDTRFTGGLATPITDGAEVTILPAVSGGVALAERSYRKSLDLVAIASESASMRSATTLSVPSAFSSLPRMIMAEAERATRR